MVTETDTGYLTLHDLFQNWWGRLRTTELVVLSACDSQRGLLRAGESPYGLTWGFMYAGAPAVVASLWPVDDRRTAELMSGLYAAMRRDGGEQVSKLQAFTQVRREVRARWPDPCYWAPFVYNGDPR